MTTTQQIRKERSFKEWAYYLFGMKIGVANLMRNSFNIGVKKTIGKICQPVNAYSRFPEYYYFEKWLAPLWQNSVDERRMTLLDIGSPKLFGFYLAYHFPVKIWLTDIDPLNIEEYKILWRALTRSAKGEVCFELQDGRHLTYTDGIFDGVYSMSVVEHVEGIDGDKRICQEMMRVVRPGGRVVLSVPFGAAYQEQTIRGLCHAAQPTRDNRFYFYQRIYDPEQFASRIGMCLTSQVKEEHALTVGRQPGWLLETCHRFSGRFYDFVRGLTGFLNPFLSRRLNRTFPEFADEIFSRYNQIHTWRDIYGDLIWMGIRREM